ncbi:MAG: hypothetical protein JSW17_06430 [Candidatus Omnitrophota bacterium]|nr:MAG: hypothetical protein JSW17_06430 [Candidatus Omnitrophota bacterium]
MVCVSGEKTGPAYEAFRILYLGFIILPLLVGLDKIFNISGSWRGYLAPALFSPSPLTEYSVLIIAGAIEIITGITVAIKPRIGACILMLWLLLVVINLAMIGISVFSAILCNFVLAMAAVALARLSVHFCR